MELKFIVNLEMLSKTQYLKYEKRISLISEDEFNSLNDIGEYYKKEFDKGFALLVLSSIKNKYFISVNLLKCEEYKLTRNERIAVIMHEYGHLFNDYETPKGYTHLPQDLLRSEGLIYLKEPKKFYEEFHADAFVKKRYKKHLIKALDKYFKDLPSDQKNLYKQRRQHIENNQVFTGQIRAKLKEVAQK